MAAWMLFCLGVSTLAAIAALAGERALLLARLPTRWVWVASILVSVGGPLLVAGRPMVPPVYPDAPPPAASPRAPSPVTIRAPWDPPRVVDLTPAWKREMDLTDEVAFRAWLAAWDVRAVLLLALAVACTTLLVRRWWWRWTTVDGVRVMLSKRTGPAVAGFLSPVVVLPRWVLALPEAQRSMILRHERQHIRGGDPPFVLLAFVALVVMPWSPALWWQIHRLRQAMELDCDARTLGREGDVAAYGSLLLDVGRFHRPCGLPVARFAESGSFLERRIRQMTARRPRDLGRRAGRWGMLAAAAASLAWTLPTPRAPEFVRPPWSPMSPTYAASPFFRTFSPFRAIERAGPLRYGISTGIGGGSTSTGMFTTHGRPFRFEFEPREGAFDRAAFFRRLQGEVRREALASGLRIVAETSTDTSLHFEYVADGLVGVLQMREGWNARGWYEVSGVIQEVAGPPGTHPTI